MTLTLYHGSNIGNIKILEPRLADHDRPYVYLTTIDAVAAFYLCNAVEKPYYWFPYGFERGGNIPIYHELYPDALKEVSDGVSGYLYEVQAGENQVIPFGDIPCARLAVEPVPVAKCVKIENAYDFLMKYAEQGKIKIGYFRDKSPEELNWWHAKITEILEKKDMRKIPNCSYARFIREKFPQIWEEYLAL